MGRFLVLKIWKRNTSRLQLDVTTGNIEVPRSPEDKSYETIYKSFQPHLKPHNHHVPANRIKSGEKQGRLQIVRWSYEEYKQGTLGVVWGQL